MSTLKSFKSYKTPPYVILSWLDEFQSAMHSLRMSLILIDEGVLAFYWCDKQTVWEELSNHIPWICEKKSVKFTLKISISRHLKAVLLNICLIFVYQIYFCYDITFTITIFPGKQEKTAPTIILLFDFSQHIFPGDSAHNTNKSYILIQCRLSNW